MSLLDDASSSIEKTLYLRIDDKERMSTSNVTKTGLSVSCYARLPISKINISYALIEGETHVKNMQGCRHGREKYRDSI